MWVSGSDWQPHHITTVNNPSILWLDTLNSTPGNVLGWRIEEAISRDWDTWKLCLLTWHRGILLGSLVGDKLSAIKTMIPEFGKSTTHKASHRGCVEIIFYSSTLYSASDSNSGIMTEKAPSFLESSILLPFLAPTPGCQKPKKKIQAWRMGEVLHISLELSFPSEPHKWP